VPARGPKLSLHPFKESEEPAPGLMRQAARKARPRGFCSPPTVLTDEKRGNPAFCTGKTLFPEPSAEFFASSFFILFHEGL
jgi:hypothetical protein